MNVTDMNAALTALKNKQLSPFSFWCQKVLPLVYDESLSYYEVLCKAGAYINQLIESDKEISEALAAFAENYGKLLSLITPELEELIDIVNQRSTAKEAFMKEGNACPNILYQCALSYLKNNDKLTYYLSGTTAYPSCFATELNEQTDLMQYFDIKGAYRDGQVVYSFTCSALVLAALLNVPYEMSRMNNGTVEDVHGIPWLKGGTNSSLTGQKMIDLFNKVVLDYVRVRDGVPEKWIYAGGLAHLLYDAGMLHKIDSSSYDKLQPGDILFGPGAEEGYWENIGHTEIFLGWNRNRAYVITSQPENTKCVQIVLRDTQYMQRLKFYARIPVSGEFKAFNTLEYSQFNPLDADAGDIAYCYTEDNKNRFWYEAGNAKDKYKWHTVEQFVTDVETETVGLYVSETKFVRTKAPLKHGAYTVLVKLDHVPSGENFRLNVAGRREVSNPDNYGSVSIYPGESPLQYAGNGIYFATFVIPDTVDESVPYSINDWGIWCADSNNLTTVNVEAFMIFDGIVNPAYVDYHAMR